jgi:hypothetical protein
MRAIQEAVASDSAVVQVTLAPDGICGACPHLEARAACRRLDGTDRDRAVMSALGLAAGTAKPWGWWLSRVGERISREWLADTCGDCQWFPLGHCSNGIQALRQSEAAGEAA